MESIGETLREARHNKMATLEDAARTTKIKLDILEKLEADEFNRLAAPMYTKGFLKLYAEYLGLDSQAVVDAYLHSQGGLRRQGLQLDTDANIRARKPRELQLPIRSVVLVVAGLTVAVVLGLLGKVLLSRHAQKTPPPSPPTDQATTALPNLPKADFDAYYQPKTRPAPAVLESPPTK